MVNLGVTILPTKVTPMRNGVKATVQVGLTDVHITEDNKIVFLGSLQLKVIFKCHARLRLAQDIHTYL